MRITRGRMSWLMALVAMVAVAGQQPGQTQAGAPSGRASQDVTNQDLLDGLKNPSEWIMYSGDYSSKRYSPLTQLTPANVNRLVAQWTFQGDQPDNMRGVSTSPIAYDGVLYYTGNFNRVLALDARTGRQIWKYQHPLPQGWAFGDAPPEFPRPGRFAHGVTRGSAIVGDRLILGTLDAHVIALDLKTGKPIWDTVIDDFKKGFEVTSAAVVGDKVIVGLGGGDRPNRCFLDAYDVKTGKRVWRLFTIPEPGEPGSETWPNDAGVMRGGATWVEGSYDPELNLIYWTTGNAQGPGNARPGDNLYTSSLIAIDPASGKIRWHYQIAPHDVMDLDANTPPVLADVTIGGQPRKVVMIVPKTAYLYVLDRATGQFITAHPLAPASTSWADSYSADGRPHIVQDSTHCLPDGQGIAGLWPPSYDPAQGLFFVTLRIDCSINNTLEPGMVANAVPGRWRIGGQGHELLRAVEPITGKVKWEFKYPQGDFGSTGVSQTRAGFGVNKSGALTTTASGLLFTGDNEGNAIAFDSRRGTPLWHYQLGAPAWASAPITYMLDGKQHVLIAAGLTLTDFAIP